MIMSGFSLQSMCQLFRQLPAPFSAWPSHTGTLQAVGRSFSTEAVRTLLNLTQLDISYKEGLDVAPLQHLSRLQKLSLQAYRLVSELCCHKVLKGSRCHLQTVKLRGKPFDFNTYQALDCLPRLKTLELTLCSLSRRQAHLLGNLSQPQRMRIEMLHDLKPRSIQALTTGRARITSLHMRWASSSLLQELQTMEHLEDLAILEPKWFTGSYLKFQPHVTRLMLQKVLGLSMEGLQHMISMLPALRQIAFLEGQYRDRWAWNDLKQEPFFPGFPGDFEDQWALPRRFNLAGLAQARHLELIILWGLSDLSFKQVHELELAVRSQGKLGLAQPVVKLFMPQQVCRDSCCRISIIIGSSRSKRFSNTGSTQTLESAWQRHKVWTKCDAPFFELLASV